MCMLTQNTNKSLDLKPVSIPVADVYTEVL